MFYYYQLCHPEQKRNDLVGRIYPSLHTRANFLFVYFFLKPTPAEGLRFLPATPPTPTPTSLSLWDQTYHVFARSVGQDRNHVTTPHKHEDHTAELTPVLRRQHSPGCWTLTVPPHLGEARHCAFRILPVMEWLLKRCIRLCLIDTWWSPSPPPKKIIWVIPAVGLLLCCDVTPM